MGREVRRVPADWQHPKDEDGRYIPLHKGTYVVDAAEWDLGHAKWSEGLRCSYGPGPKWVPRETSDGARFTDWGGRRPSPDDYMPDWPEERLTHLMMYENTSEGTPISPAFATPEELARWLADTGASSFGGMTATYEQWLSVARGGRAPSMAIVGGEMMSGAAFVARQSTPPADVQDEGGER